MSPIVTFNDLLSMDNNVYDIKFYRPDVFLYSGVIDIANLTIPELPGRVSFEYKDMRVVSQTLVDPQEGLTFSLLGTLVAIRKGASRNDVVDVDL